MPIRNASNNKESKQQVAQQHQKPVDQSVVRTILISVRLDFFLPQLLSIARTKAMKTVFVCPLSLLF